MKLTGSKIHRVWKCPASAVLPRYADSNEAKFEPARDRGKAIHAFLENVKRAGRGAALAESPPELLPLLEALDLDNLPVGLACEVAFAWNWKLYRARELARSPNLPRRADGGVDYDALGVDWSCEIPCTLDVVGVQELEATPLAREPRPVRIARGYVGDYKSGHAKYPAPDMFGQTLLGALCVRSVWGCDDVVVELIHIHDNGGHHSARRTVTDWDLDAFERELAEAMESIEDAGPRCLGCNRFRPTSDGENYDEKCFVCGHVNAAKPTPVEGPWCDYCPAFRSCPAKVALVRQIPAELANFGIRPDPESGALTLTPGELTVRNAAAAWMALERIEDVIARAKEEVCSIAAFEEIPLPDGRVIGRLITERRGIDGKVGAEVIEQRFGAPARREFVEEVVTMSALRQAASKYKQPGEKIETKNKDGAYDRALAEIENRGGLELKITDAVRPHVPKRKKLPG